MPPLETPDLPLTFIEKIWARPYLVVAIAAALICVAGFAIVIERSGVSSSQSGTAWTGTGNIFSSGAGNRAAPQGTNPPDAIKQTTPTPLGYIPLPQTNDAATSGTTDDLAQLLAQLSHPAIGGSIPANTSDAYSYIPSGLITVPSPKTRTPTEAALYAYGNTVGTAVQSFESMNGNTTQILKDQAEDRSDPEKKATLQRLGRSYEQLGRDLSDMEHIPDDANGAHIAYATSYQTLGKNLAEIADAPTDAEYLDAITKYNDSADNLTKRFLGLTALFSANNVTFSSSDPGSMFVFTGAGF